MKLKLDLHLHTNSSPDCGMILSKIIRIAKKRGLGGIAITDHDSFEEFSKTINNSKEVLVIRGMEIKTEIGDVLALFLKEEIKSRGFKEVSKEVKKQGGILIVPHPAVGHILTEDVLKNADAIEIFNSRLNESANKFAEDLAKKIKKPGIASSDAHTYWEIGSSYIIVDVKEKSFKEIKKAILDSRFEVVQKRLPKWKRILIKLFKYFKENAS